MTRISPRTFARSLSIVTALGCLAIIHPGTANAGLLRLTYSGVFSTDDALNLSSAPTATPFSSATPYTLVAVFDTTTTNLVGGLPFPGFVAYSPVSAIMTIGGVSYTVDSFNANPTGGIGISIFDASNIFNPGLYAVGFIQDPAADGSGVVGDFSSASPGFSVNNLVSTTFGGYNGAGFSSGPNFGAIVQPITLRRAGQQFNLTLGNRDEEFALDAPLNTAVLEEIPEPAALTLGGSALALFAVCRLARRAIG